MRTPRLVSASLCMLVGQLAVSQSHAQRLMEHLDRGLVAINQAEQGVFLSWRLLGSDSLNVGFNVYRISSAGQAKKLNDEPLITSTNFIDRAPDLSSSTSYLVRTVSKGKEGAPSKPFTFPANPPTRDYLSIPTSLPSGYRANDASVGDLDGDGQYEIVVHIVGRGHDNSHGGLTDAPIFQAYKLDGTLLWTINLGKNIREGAHYTQFMVYDFDCDGRAELVCKTADGTTDGMGHILGDPDADWRVQPPPQEAVSGATTTTASAQTRPRDRTPETTSPAAPSGASAQNGREDRGGRRERRFRWNWDGRWRRVPSDVGKILSGPEYLTVFDGKTGAAVNSVTYLPQRAPGIDNPSREEQAAIWGDSTGNRMDRFLATIAYLDGVHPSLVMCRGYYTRTVLAAWDFRDGKLQQRWMFDSDQVGSPGRENPWRGQGNHSVSTADVDQDGKDEIIFGAMVIDDDGAGLYSTRLGHGDAQHTSDLDPTRPGLEIWSIHENEHPPADFVGSELRDARTGEILFIGARGEDVGRGMAADIDPRHPGYELWGGTDNLYSAQGEDIGPRPRSQNMAIWWDGDLLRELLDGVRINKWDYENGRETTIFSGRDQGLAANNGTKSNPCLSADILGDWREELIARTFDNRELRVYVSTIPTEHRLTTLMHDAQYRIGIAWQNAGYNQPPHPSFFLGVGMALPPEPAMGRVKR